MPDNSYEDELLRKNAEDREKNRKKRESNAHYESAKQKWLTKYGRTHGGYFAQEVYHAIAFFGAMFAYTTIWIFGGIPDNPWGSPVIWMPIVGYVVVNSTWAILYLRPSMSIPTVLIFCIMAIPLYLVMCAVTLL